MNNTTILPTWAPRLKPYRIHQLYESDTRGYLDDELLYQVGWALYARCDSFIKANEAKWGMAPYPVCGETVSHGLNLRKFYNGE